MSEYRVPKDAPPVDLSWTRAGEALKGALIPDQLAAALEVVKADPAAVRQVMDLAVTSVLSVEQVAMAFASVTSMREVEMLRTQRAAVLALHRRCKCENDCPGYCIECSGAHFDDVTDWPCRTVRALGAAK